MPALSKLYLKVLIRECEKVTNWEKASHNGVNVTQWGVNWLDFVPGLLLKMVLPAILKHVKFPSYVDRSKPCMYTALNKVS